MSDKVHGGTPKGSVSICVNCRNAQSMNGINFQQVVYCRGMQPPIRVNFPVATCSIFDDKRVPSLYQMENIAWTVQSRNRGPVGFEAERRTQITIEPPNRDRPTESQPAAPITGEDD